MSAPSFFYGIQASPASMRGPSLAFEYQALLDAISAADERAREAKLPIFHPESIAAKASEAADAIRRGAQVRMSRETFDALPRFVAAGDKTIAPISPESARLFGVPIAIDESVPFMTFRVAEQWRPEFPAPFPKA